MTVYQQIIDLLDSLQIKYTAIEHVPTKTCEESAKVRSTSPDQGAKALVCIADKQPIMIVLPCSRRLDTKAFKTQFSFKDLRFATPEASLLPWANFLTCLHLWTSHLAKTIRLRSMPAIIAVR